MENEKNIENENEEINPPISYRYQNAEETEYNPNKNITSIKTSDSGVDIMKKINEAADNLESIIDKNDLKIFNKYEDLSVEKLKKLLDEKNENLLKLNQNKEDSKSKLNNLLKEINKTITDNSKILYKENPDPEIIYNLQKEIENKKKELKIKKSINHTFKCQYKAMNSKFLQKNPNEKENGEEKISNLKKVNKKLQFNINKYKDDTVSKKQKIEENKDFPNEVKIKSEEIRKLTSHKNECYSKIKMSIKSLENLIKEISHLEEMSQKKYEKEGDENLNNKINYWIDIIRSDLSGNQEEIIDKIDKNETNFIKEINKIDSQNNNKKAKSTSFDENQKEINLELSYNLKQVNIKNRLLNSNVLKNNYKGIFGKFNYLKFHPTMNNKTKLTKINNNIKNNSITLEDTKNYRSKILNDIDSIIEKDYEDTTDTEFRELLDKKSQYLETNVRLERNIREIEKTKKSKILSISYTVQENEKKLNELKEQNDLLEQEIMNLQQLMQLTIDKERLKLEIKNDKKNKNIIIENNNAIKEKPVVEKTIPDKLETALGNENIIKKKMKINSVKKEKKMKKNRSGYREDEVSPEPVVVENREQRLKKIKKKYLDEIENEEKKEKENKDNKEINKEKEEKNNEEKDDNINKNNEEVIDNNNELNANNDVINENNS